jgi:hypothetical protein
VAWDISHCYGKKLSIYDAKAYSKKRHELRSSVYTWQNKFTDKPTQESLDLKCNIIDWLWNFPERVKLRVENPHLDIYLENEPQLERLVSCIPQDLKSYVSSVVYPRNDEVQKLTSEGYVVIKRPIAHKYLVECSPGGYSSEELHRLRQYLDNIDAKYTAYLKSRLSPDPTGRYYLASMRFYVHDISHAEFIHLVLNRVRMKIHEVRLVP